MYLWSHDAVEGIGLIATRQETDLLSTIPTASHLQPSMLVGQVRLGKFVCLEPGLGTIYSRLAMAGNSPVRWPRKQLDNSTLV